MRTLDIILAIALLGALLALGQHLLDRQTRLFTGVARVIDGDTIIVTGARLRLAGIDAPELDQTCGADDTIPCGHVARDALTRIVRGIVRCTAMRTDRYGRPLAQCRTTSDEDVATAMVRAGQAVDAGCCAAAERSARAASRGLWAAPFVRPAAWRAQHPDRSLRE